jgi:hypothetical protein
MYWEVASYKEQWKEKAMQGHLLMDGERQPYMDITSYDPKT